MPTNEMWVTFTGAAVVLIVGVAFAAIGRAIGRGRAR